MSFLRDYMTYASHNEAPYMYHVWCAYYCLSATITRRVWMFIDGKSIHCNLYVMLVGGAGGAKSSALDKVHEIFARLNLPVSGDKETPEGIIRFMAGDKFSNPKKPIDPYGGGGYNHQIPNHIYPDGRVLPRGECYPMNIIASEFVDFIKADPEGWINVLNNIWDRERYKYRTKNMGEDFLPGPFVTLLGCLPTETMETMQKESVITTGLARRTLFQYGERDYKRPIPRPQQTPAQLAALDRCVDHLKRFATVSGEFAFDDVTGKWWDEWYCENHRLMPTRPSSIRSWYWSKGTMLMKLAMLTSLSERTDLVLEIKHFELALSYLNELEKDLYKIFGGVGKNSLADTALTIFNHICMQGEPIAYNVLRVQLWRSLPYGNGISPVKALDECLDQLVAEGKIQVYALTIGAQSERQYATPEQWSLWKAANAGVTVVLATAVPPETPLAASPVVDPSSELTPVPLDPKPEASQAESQ